MRFFLGGLFGLALVALAVMPARAQTGFDRPGGDYARFTVPSGDPAGLFGALRPRRALPGLDLLLSGHGRDRRQQCSRHAG